MQWCAGFSGPFWEAYHELIPKAQGTTGAPTSWHAPVMLMV